MCTQVHGFMEVFISQYFHWNYITGLSPPKRSPATWDLTHRTNRETGENCSRKAEKHQWEKAGKLYENQQLLVVVGLLLPFLHNYCRLSRTAQWKMTKLKGRKITQK